MRDLNWIDFNLKTVTAIYTKLFTHSLARFHLAHRFTHTVQFRLTWFEMERENPHENEKNIKFQWMQIS